MRSATSRRSAPTTSGVHEGVENHAGAGDKGCRAADSQGSRDIPGVGCDHPEVTGRHPQALRHHLIGFGCGFQALDGIGGENVLEGPAQTGVGQSGLGDLGG
jgi:hypothetical protein